MLNVKSDKIEMEDDVADAFSEAGEECNISNEDMKRIWNALNADSAGNSDGSPAGRKVLLTATSSASVLLLCMKR